jgi:LDH2 family malate/lactate/ureidoglycolate dehydrogenase
VLRESPGALVVDGDAAFGAVSAKYGMERCIEKARLNGSACVSVIHGNHCGFMAYYTMMAAKENMIGLALTNSMKNVTVWGTFRPFMGTNPLSVAIPAASERDVVFDAATSVVASGKLTVAQLEGKPIPDHWAVDSEGHSTTDPVAAAGGAMLPAGMYKGSGIAMLISLICAGLGDLPFDYELFEERVNASACSDVGFFFHVINIAAFTDVGRFKDRVDGFIRTVKRLETAPGFEEVLMPGEKEFLFEEKCRKAGGFEIGLQLYEKLRDIGESLGLSLDVGGREAEM